MKKSKESIFIMNGKVLKDKLPADSIRGNISVNVSPLSSILFFNQALILYSHLKDIITDSDDYAHVSFAGSSLECLKRIAEDADVIDVFEKFYSDCKKEFEKNG